MPLHLKFFFMVIAACVVTSYTKLEKIATGVKFFELTQGSSIVHSSKVDGNFYSRLGRRILLARCTGLCLVIIRDIPVLGLVRHLSALPKTCLKSTFAANSVGICWDRPWGVSSRRPMLPGICTSWVDPWCVCCVVRAQVRGTAPWESTTLTGRKCHFSESSLEQVRRR